MSNLDRWRRIPVTVLLAGFLFLPPAFGAELPKDLADRIRENQRDLVRHAWTMQMEIEDAGRALGSTTERLRFGREGYVEREMLRDDRKRAARQPEMEALIERVIATVVPYAFPNPEAAARFLGSAEVTEKEDQLRIQGKGFLAEEDTMELIAGDEPLRAVSMAVVTLLEELPLRIKAEYTLIEGGPNVIRRITADYKDLRLTVVNTDYERLR